MEKALEFDPKHSWSYGELSKIFSIEGKKEEAIANYKKARKLNEFYKWAHPRRQFYKELRKYSRKK